MSRHVHFQASGFCYVNDIVIAILELLKFVSIKKLTFLLTTVHSCNVFPFQIPPSCSLHRHRHSSWRRRAGGLLSHRPSHDRVVPQIRKLFLSRNRYVCLFRFLLIVGCLFRFSALRCVFAGDMYEVGAESGKYYSVNVPLKEGINDEREH